MISLLLRGLFMPSETPSGHLAVYVFLEMIALAFVFGAVEALVSEKPWYVWVSCLVLGVLFFLAGIKWGTRTGFVIVALLAATVVVYGVYQYRTRRPPPPAPTATAPEPTTPPKIDQPKTSESSQPLRKSFSIVDPRSMVNMKRKLTASSPVWVRYSSQWGMAISPIPVLMFIDITSLVPTPETIEDYSVSAQTDSCAGWTELTPIRLFTGDFLWLENGGIKTAIPLDFSHNALDAILKSPIPAYGTVSGWWFFDSTRDCSTNPGATIKYKISFNSFSGKHFDEITQSRKISEPNEVPWKSQALMTGMEFIIPPGPRVDLSHDYVRFYSDGKPVARQFP
jgi:hypothetical protein